MLRLRWLVTVSCFLVLVAMGASAAVSHTEYLPLVRGRPWPTPDAFANPAGLDWVAVPAGTFEMGALNSDPEADWDEKPRHTVTLSAYRISRTEVTNEQYGRFMAAGGYVNHVYWSDAGWEWRTSHDITEPESWTDNTVNQANFPVVGVCWYEMEAFCRWAGGRLPTEAQWEYAARGGPLSQGYTYAGGNDADAVAWYRENSGGITHEVGQKLPNELGLYDMNGNVWEMCYDFHHGYGAEPLTDPEGPPFGGGYHVVRGSNCRTLLRFLRLGDRDASHPEYRSQYGGFRVARAPLP